MLIKYLSAAIILISLSFFFLNLCFAETSVSINKENYEVEGLNAMGIYNQVRRRSEIKYDGITFAGQANSYIEPSYKWDKKDGKYYVTSVYIKVNATITMPTWVNYRQVSREWQQEWDRFYKALYNHEQNHINIAVKAAKSIESALMQPRGFESYNLLKAHVDRICNDGYKLLNLNQKEYDNRTNHGHSEGAYIKRKWGRP